MTRPDRRSACAACACALLYCGLVPAQPSSEDALEEVHVTARSIEDTIPLDLAEYGNRLEVLPYGEIELKGYTEVSQALQMLVPGLHVRPKNGAFDYVDVSLQGSRREEILWLIDGVRINNRLYNGTSPLDTIPSHMIERIEVLKGGQGIFYGTQSVGGVVNILTRTLQDEPEGAAGLGVNSNDGFNAHAYYRGSAGPHRFLAYASRDEADGFQPYRDEDIQPSAADRERGYEVNVGGLKYGVNLGESTTLTVQYQRTDNELDFARPMLNARTTNERSEDILMARLDYLPSDSFGLYVKAYYHDWDTHYTRIYNVLDDDGNVTGDQRVVNDRSFWGYEDYGLNAMAEFRLHRGFEYVAGFDHQRYSGEDDVWRIADQEEEVNALYLQVRTTPELWRDTRLAFGVRYNRPDTIASATVWNFSGRHEINDQWYVQGTLGTSFRLPDAEALFLNEIYDENGDGVPDFFFSVGNPDLEPEESRNLNLGVGAEFDRFRFELTGYVREITHYIQSYVPVEIAGVEGESFTNSDDEVDVVGMELITAYDLGQGWAANLSVNFNESELNEDGVQLTGIPESEVKAGLNYQAPERPWGASLTAVWVGDLNARPGVERGDYLVADLAAWYRFGRSERHRLSLRLENLTDETYATRVDVASADRGGSYFYNSLGTPRTLHLFYAFGF
ncbi:TonB-dependent receptor plug domain-containing protein [Elongatibacter sediminis]|uniref:TonB-dependent receptor n=1 Tax=Elongatibacter sediminis TaxID=3119006 RepID=A0AAW9RGD9_9GAMM